MLNSVIILGGGISGLSLGWKLIQQGIPVHILEALPYAGGLAGTIRERAYALDFGPHSFFTEDEEIKRTILNLFGDDGSFRRIPRSVKFQFEGKLLDYPLTAASVLSQMGFQNSVLSILGYLSQLLKPHRRNADASEDLSVEEWAIGNFGNHLYQTFFKPYTEEFWKIPCSELSARSIPTHTRLSFGKTLRFLVNKRFRREASSQLDRESLDTYYPSTGYGEISDRLAQQFVAWGGKIHFQSYVTQVLHKAHSVEVSFLRELEEKTLVGDTVVSTVPIPHFIRMIKPSAPQSVFDSAYKLDYRPLIFLGMVIKRDNILGSAYRYVLHRPYNRLTDMNQFSPQTSPLGENILAVEVPCSRESALWHYSSEELFEYCISSLENDKILKRSEVIGLVLAKAPYAYPVYKKNYAVHLEAVLDYIRSLKNTFLLGRTGEFMYMDIDRCMRRAFTLADKILHQFNERKVYAHVDT